jgi:predicted Zn-ribbon and HTH transcriptional regulator
MRSSFVPVCSAEPNGSINQIGGSAWLPARCRLPQCPKCKSRTVLGFQVDLESLPFEFALSGILQIFLCAADDGSSACFIEDSGYVVRLETRPLQARAAAKTWQIPGMSIRDWEPKIEPPSPPNFPNHWYVDEAADYLDMPSDDFKCGGWPHWIQQIYQPSRCPSCRQPTTFLVQLASHLLPGVYFGDCGLLYIHACETGCKEWVGGQIQYY